MGSACEVKYSYDVVCFDFLVVTSDDERPTVALIIPIHSPYFAWLER